MNQIPTSEEVAKGRREYVESCSMEYALASYGVPRCNPPLLDRIKRANEEEKKEVRLEIERLQGIIRDEMYPILEQLTFLDKAIKGWD